MKYKDAVTQSMEMLARDPKVVFLGYNITRGTRAYGTLSNVPKSRCIETPVAENLMADLAIGLSLEGYKPVLFFERHDFVLIALDSLVNHLDKMEKISKEEFKSSVLVRAVVGGTIPFYPGMQHTQDFTEIFKRIFHFPVLTPKTAGEVMECYKRSSAFDKPYMILEKRDDYELED